LIAGKWADLSLTSFGISFNKAGKFPLLLVRNIKGIFKAVSRGPRKK